MSSLARSGRRRKSRGGREMENTLVNRIMRADDYLQSTIGSDSRSKDAVQAR